MKVCSVCNKTKELVDFHRHRGSPDGLRYACKLCRRLSSQIYNRKNKEKISASKRISRSRWRRDNPQMYAKQCKHVYDTSPLKYAARRKVRDALRKNILLKPTQCCINTERCKGAIEAHHEDYTKPLDVQWLCRMHHSSWHSLFISN